MRPTFLALLLVSASAWCQRAPVTRSEFAELFTAVARGYVSAGLDVLPQGFQKDAAPVSRDEVSNSMLLVAIGSGRLALTSESALDALKAAKLMPADHAFFTDPGANYRPSDLVAALIAFSEGIAERNKPQSADDKRLSTPGSGGGNGGS
ncbi:MAG: hypothetical protein ABIV13_02965 [Fimbriimonadales bacterium]